MIGGKSVLGVITARGGSKGLPGKHLRPFLGEPLIARTIAAGRAAEGIDRLILSSDDPDIIAVADSLGCEAPFVREARLSGDAASSIDVVLDAAARVPGYDVVVLLQPTSPLRLAQDIDGTLAAMLASGAPSAVSVCAATCHPWLIFGTDERARLTPYSEPPAGASMRRQDLPAAWSLNGAVYAARLDWLREARTFFRPGETVAYEMPANRSADIDTLEDFLAAERAAAGG